MPEPRPFVDPSGLVEFWQQEYLDAYVRAGGGSVKWLKGRDGSGKTRVLEAIGERAGALGYLTAALRADEVALGRFDEVYRAVMRQVPVRRIGEAVARTAASRLGAPSWVPGARSLEEALRQDGRPAAAVQEDLSRAFDFLYEDHDLAPPVVAAVRRMAAPLLIGGEAAWAAAVSAEGWLRGEPLRSAERRHTGIFLALDRYSARDVLQSVLHLLRAVGLPGMVWTIDALERVLQSRAASPGDPPSGVRYTALRRLDAYEGIRELIDEGGSLPGLFVVFAGRPEVFDDERAGLVTYPALAMRVETEIQADTVNLFNDVQDLDRLWRSDWPRLERELVRAYGRDEDGLDLSRMLVDAPVSPVRRLVEYLTGEGGGAGA